VENDVSNPKVLVALHDEESVDGLVNLACQLSNGMNADLEAVHVVEIGAGLPLDGDYEVLNRPAKEILYCARRIAKESFSRDILIRLIPAHHVGKAVVSEAKDQGVDLLVMGYHQKHGVGEILFGSTVQYVAGHAPCRLIIQVPPVNVHECCSAALIPLPSPLA
jgi:nucleotide-binding universal stress UspA family protein